MVERDAQCENPDTHFYEYACGCKSRALEARLAEAENMNAKAEKIALRLAEAERLLRAVENGAQADIDGRNWYDCRDAFLRTDDSAPAELCLARKVGTDEPLERCAEYPRCICGGPEGWPDDSAEEGRK